MCQIHPIKIILPLNIVRCVLHPNRYKKRTVKVSIMSPLLVVFVIVIGAGIVGPVVSLVSSVELVIDDMTEVVDWSHSGGESPETRAT